MKRLGYSENYDVKSCCPSAASMFGISDRPATPRHAPRGSPDESLPLQAAIRFKHVMAPVRDPCTACLDHAKHVLDLAHWPRKASSLSALAAGLCEHACIALKAQGCACQDAPACFGLGKRCRCKHYSECLRYEPCNGQGLLEELTTFSLYSSWIACR